MAPRSSTSHRTDTEALVREGLLSACRTLKTVSDRNHCMLGSNNPEPKENQRLGLKCSFYKQNRNTKLTWLKVVTKYSYYAVESKHEATEKSKPKTLFFSPIKPEE